MTLFLRLKFEMAQAWDAPLCCRCRHLLECACDLRWCPEARRKEKELGGAVEVGGMKTQSQPFTTRRLTEAAVPSLVLAHISFWKRHNFPIVNAVDSVLSNLLPRLLVSLIASRRMQSDAAREYTLREYSIALHPLGCTESEFSTCTNLELHEARLDLCLDWPLVIDYPQEI
jgi:hypothetical protein